MAMYAPKPNYRGTLLQYVVLLCILQITHSVLLTLRYL